MKNKERIDLLLLQRSLVDSRAKAQARIIAGDVIVNDNRIDKPGTLVDKMANIRLRNNSLPYVSRGGLKLAAAFKKWPINLQNKICIDIGASTGGFTDVLLQNNAKMVYAVDVGYGQLAWALRNDKRVINLERTHINKLDVNILQPKPEIAVIDVSFISLTNILDSVIKCLTDNSAIYMLIKPQFESCRQDIDKGGIVKSAANRKKAIDKVGNKLDQLGIEVVGIIQSPITGARGNIEYILHAKKDKKQNHFI